MLNKLFFFVSELQVDDLFSVLCYLLLTASYIIGPVSAAALVPNVHIKYIDKFAVCQNMSSVTWQIRDI